MADKTAIPKVIRDWYRQLGKRGVAGRLRGMTPAQRSEFARLGGLARQAKAKAARQSGTNAA